MKKAIISLALCAATAAYATTPVVVASASTTAPTTASVAPQLSSEQVAHWLANTLSKSFSHDYVNWKSVINHATETWYTPTGKAAFYQILESRNHVPRIAQDKNVVYPTIHHKPVVTATDENSWTLEAPLLIGYYQITAKEKRLSFSQVFLMKATVVRSTVSDDNPQGLAINNLSVLQEKTEY